MSASVLGERDCCQVPGLWGGKFYKGVKAALLGVNQLVQQRTVGIVEMTESKTKGAAGRSCPASSLPCIR